MYIDKSIEERDRPDDPPPIEQDDERLKQLGIRREMKREFTNFTTISFALGILGCSASIASTFITPLLLGGPATAIWAWFLGSFGSFALAASVAELVSAYPTAGGIYTCTAFLIPKKYRSIIPFLSAWITVVGQLATPASVTFALSQMVFGAVTISTDGAFIASKGQTLGLYVGLTVGLGIFNTLPTKFLHRITFFYVFVNIATSIAIIIAIPTAGAKNLASHRFVWTSVVDHSGWNNPPFAFLLGILSVAWVMTDYDGAAHLNEEVRNAAIATPVAIVTAASATDFLSILPSVMVFGTSHRYLAQLVSHFHRSYGTTSARGVLWHCGHS